jgi:hypothetical protein
MKVLKVARTLAALTLVFALGASALADTIRMKDGQVIRGQIVAFRDQQFTVLIGSSRGGGSRRSRMMINMEDVESIEFDSAGTADASSAADDNTSTAPAETTRTQPAPQPTPRREEPRQTAGQRPPTLGNDPGSASGNTGGTANTGNAGRTNAGAAPVGGSPFFPVRVRVSAGSVANGWTDSGLMVRKGQRLRISATGRVSLGEGRFSTPTGLPRVVDTEKLMRNEPTGTLIAVIGDDNDDFIAIGANREFYAPRDGRLFLGVNEGKLEDNTGSYDALIEVEPLTTSGGDR